jgi:hypothetical protein
LTIDDGCLFVADTMNDPRSTRPDGAVTVRGRDAASRARQHGGVVIPVARSNYEVMAQTVDFTTDRLTMLRTTYRSPSRRPVVMGNP